MKTGTVYMLTSPSGKSYVGQTIHFERRMYEHENRPEGALKNAITKYGWDQFKVTKLFEDVPEQDLDALEIHAIWLMDTHHNGYNADIGGNRKIGCTHTDETKRKISDSLKGCKRSDETKRKMSEAHKGLTSGMKGKPGPNKGKKFSEETKRKMSESHKKRWAKRKANKIN